MGSARIRGLTRERHRLIGLDRRLEPRHFNVLALPVAEFLADSTGQPVAGTSPSQRASSFMEFARQTAGVRAPVSVLPSTPFLRVLELLGGHTPRIHRVYVCEEKRPIGVITPTDVLRFLAVREMA